MSVTLNTTRGRIYVRALIARTLAGIDAPDFAAARWGQHSPVATYIRQTVGGLEHADLITTGPPDEFFELVRQASIVGRLVGLRQVPFNVRLIAMTAGARGYWVGEKKAIPLSKPSLLGSSLPSRKIAGIIVTTKEALETPGDAAETVLQNDLIRACVEMLDETFIDAGNSGDAETPPSVTNGATSSASGGDPAADLATLVEGFAGELERAYLVTDPLTAAEIGMSRDAGGSFQFPDVGVRGGSALGIPLLTSRSSPRDTDGGQLALVDPTGIAAGQEGVEISNSSEATLIMSDDPESEATERVSMFQTESLAFKAVLRANWERQRTGSVSVITGATYPAAT